MGQEYVGLTFLTKTTMMLFIEAICQGVTCTNLTYWEKDYESAFEELTNLVAEGFILQRALLVDGRSRIELPVAVFDGQSFLKPLRQLEQQWHELIRQRPAPMAAPTHERLIDWHEQLIVYYQQQLGLIQTMILYIERGLRHVTQMRNPEMRIRIQRQYVVLLANQKRLLQRT